jgi:hypothetical protein
MFSRYTPHAILFGIALIVVMAVELGEWIVSCYK